MLRDHCVARWGPLGEVAIHGVLESIETESVDLSPTHVRYRAVLEPRLSRLRHSVRSRVFQNVDVGQIATSILEEHGFKASEDFDLLLASSYPVSEYTLQFRSRTSTSSRDSSSTTASTSTSSRSPTARSS